MNAATKYHEAGHAVVALALGLRPSHVGREGSGGEMHGVLPAHYSPEAHPEAARAIVVVSLAGLAAEERLGAPVDIAGARGDLEDAFEAADALAGEDALRLLRDCQAEARRIVNERWAAVERVAAALANSSRGWLDEDELRQAAARRGLVPPPPGVD